MTEIGVLGVKYRHQNETLVFFFFDKYKDFKIPEKGIFFPHGHLRRVASGISLGVLNLSSMFI